MPGCLDAYATLDQAPLCPSPPHSLPSVALPSNDQRAGCQVGMARKEALEGDVEVGRHLHLVFGDAVLA